MKASIKGLSLTKSEDEISLRKRIENNLFKIIEEVLKEINVGYEMHTFLLICEVLCLLSYSFHSEVLIFEFLIEGCLSLGSNFDI
jgi:hypothetical protein